jgi:membrane-associated phospholipid phosphatase
MGASEANAPAVLRQAWVWWWLVVLALAVALTLAVEFDALPDEVGAVRKVQGWVFPGKTLSDVARAVTSTEFVVVVGVPMVALHWLARDRRGAAVLVVLLIVMPLAQSGLKQLVDKPRPSESGIEARGRQTSPSFPSGHVMGSTVVYGWAIVMLGSGHLGRRQAASQSTDMGAGGRVHAGDARPEGRRPTSAGEGRSSMEGGLPVADRISGGVYGRLKPPSAEDGLRLLGMALLFAAVLLTGVASVYLGVHWPSDVVGGYLWGLVLLLPGLAVALEWGAPHGR